MFTNTSIYKVGLPDVGRRGSQEECVNFSSAGSFEGSNSECGVEGVGAGGRAKRTPFNSGLAGSNAVAC